ncbi:glycosyltransferase [Oxalobacteraceae bacterium OM1]|nr:glycosyltransferase [Oxalobacteraceae bacterium OM1]
MPGITFHAIFCTRREPNRLWDLPPLEFDHVFLKERYHEVGGRYIHNNPDVIGALRRFAPDIVITDGFNPTHLYAFAYAAAKGLVHIAMTDGTDVSEQGLSRIHRAVRRIVYARTAAFCPASVGGERHYEAYGITADRCFKSCLCIDNHAFTTAPQEAKTWDLMFSGRIEPVKNPMFALRVAAGAARRLGRPLRMLVAGAGSLEPEMRRAAADVRDVLDVHFHGYAAQRELPALYRASRLFLFPTLWDPWGVVANEACAAGLPVIVTPEAGVAGELVRDGENGYVRALDEVAWTDGIAAILADPLLEETFSRRSMSLVQEYTFDHAAQGLLDACRFALGGPRGVPQAGGSPG